MSAEYDNENGRYDDEPRFARDRSASPRDEPRGDRARSRSPHGRADDRAPVDSRKPDDDEEGAINPGSNLFVTGIHPRLTESDISRLFEKYGDVENCSIMLDPHTKESRGFGFVKMVTAEQADAAKEGLQGEVIEGRTLSIEKARRSRPRTPTPGKYFGPPSVNSVDLVAAAAVVTVMMTDADLTVAAGVAAAAAVVVVTTTVMVVMTPTVIVVTMVVAAKAAANTATILVVNIVTTTATVVALIATPPVVVVAVKSATATPLLPANPTLAALMNPVVVKTDTVAGR
ncbi:RNA recognition motif domain-containing protein [Aspergillus novofumigatus IBT 16806]|uniref:RNA-binding domain-containing protein n=1 Tax=Aspergillus novofumigatus (strain IBT 16806) TaxID=1392255 RepID=A0A2I1BZ86_ASPN1|nr:RNA-binding domain-containing protein [Aspergillus novofumigatus IBT 16806]PKX90702.1 RNA-binding domain-containing protein [Aspergillus novofumigatus IBT 16806]